MVLKCCVISATDFLSSTGELLFVSFESQGCIQMAASLNNTPNNNTRTGKGPFKDPEECEKSTVVTLSGLCHPP